MQTIFEKSRPGRGGKLVAGGGDGGDVLPRKFLREEPPNLPRLSEAGVVRHYTHLSQRNVGVDTTFYPLGSCTMKYNPKVNEAAAALGAFAGLHPYMPAEDVQGILKTLAELEEFLAEIGGFEAVTLQPAAGAHGEMTGLLLIRAYHDDRGEERDTVLIPDSAHGTNPASCTLAGYRTRSVASDARGLVDMADFRAKVDSRVATLMLTNPNTLGLFEEDVCEITRILHDNGSLLYMDGANLNAILGISRPGDFGVDVMHYNLHKTFSTPHGGGGPGSGPVGVKAPLVPFLPSPRIRKADGAFRFEDAGEKSIGRVRSWLGNVGVMIKAWAYIRRLGDEGLRRVASMSVLNANYVMAALRDAYKLPYDRPCMHECVFSARTLLRQHGVRAVDVAKRLIDLGFHPPTVYFPLIVDEALMIEPTETESIETLDAFIAAMRQIAGEAETDPAALKSAPVTTPVGRLDEVKAVKSPCLVMPGGTGAGAQRR
jgi:glycine dehydrogenase subunit 2